MVCAPCGRTDAGTGAARTSRDGPELAANARVLHDRKRADPVGQDEFHRVGDGRVGADGDDRTGHDPLDEQPVQEVADLAHGQAGRGGRQGRAHVAIGDDAGQLALRDDRQVPDAPVAHEVLRLCHRRVGADRHGNRGHPVAHQHGCPPCPPR
jgi:hypothetical protein